MESVSDIYPQGHKEASLNTLDRSSFQVGKTHLCGPTGSPSPVGEVLTVFSVRLLNLKLRSSTERHKFKRFGRERRRVLLAWRVTKGEIPVCNVPDQLAAFHKTQIVD